jgi:molecular chaperone GrpE
VTTGADETALSALSERLDSLTDLFKRRLLDDRAKQAVIEDLQARLTRADKEASATALKPLVDSLALVIERLQSGQPSAELVASIGNELEYILESIVGVTTISAAAGDAIDRLRHEVVSAAGQGTDLRVAELVRTGYEKDGVVLRPAKVTAVRVMTAAGAGLDGGV